MSRESAKCSLKEGIKMAKGVELVMVPDIKIPKRLFYAPELHFIKTEWKGKSVLLLRIKGSEASFYASGEVYIKFPGRTNFRRMFPKKTVYEVRDFGGNNIQRDPKFCENCFTFSRKVVAEVRDPKCGCVEGRTMECSNCGQKWEIP